MNAPHVSVLMPVYDAEAYLGEALRSILSQSFANFELLVVDDGSCDRSREIAGGFATHDERIRILAGEHAGLVACLNRGLEAARGLFVARMDADDVSLPTRFARQLEHLETHPDCTVVGSAYLSVDAAGDPIAPIREPLDHAEIDRLHMQGGGGGARIAHPTVMMRTRAIRDVGGYREQFPEAQDLDLFLRMAECGRLANLPELLLHYRIHPKSVGVSRRPLQLERVAAAVADAHRRRGMPLPDGALDSLPQPHAGASDIGGWIVSEARRHGYLDTARKHAWAALRARPWSRRSWYLMSVAWFGR
jgi:glycosyltransferase involved in cell wall biosynthesis